MKKDMDEAAAKSGKKGYKKPRKASAKTKSMKGGGGRGGKTRGDRYGLSI